MLIIIQFLLPDCFLVLFVNILEDFDDDTLVSYRVGKHLLVVRDLSKVTTINNSVDG